MVRLSPLFHTSFMGRSCGVNKSCNKLMVLWYCGAIVRAVGTSTLVEGPGRSQISRFLVRPGTRSTLTVKT